MSTTTLEPVIITEPYIEVRPDHLLPRPKKPSEILREMPQDRWMRGNYADGEGSYCALGWLASQIGLRPCGQFLASGNRDHIDGTFMMDAFYGFDTVARIAVVSVNDHEGLGSVIQYLECIGR